MSDDSKPQPIVDLSDLRLMPTWVANFGKDEPRQRAAREEDDSRGGDGGRRPFRNDRGGDRDRGAPRRSFGGGGPGGAGGPGRPPMRDGDRGRPGGGQGGAGGPRREGDRPRGDGPRRDGDRGRGRFDGPPDRPAIPSGVKVIIEPEERALEALIQHIRAQGRAFALFDAARLVLAGEERYQVKFQSEPERLVGFYQVQGVDALYETKEEAMRYMLRSPEALGLYYKVEDVELEEPKGVFTSIAVCGMSGEIFGPPSHHSYQLAVKRLHNERFSDMSLEDYKRRIQVKTEPEVVEKWKEQQRKGTKWTWLKGPALEEGQEPVSFTTLAEVEAHFRRMHGEGSIIEVRNCILHGTVRREQLSPGLGRLYRRTLEETRKHLFELSQRVAQGLERRGLKLFKRRGGKLYVSRIKPRAVDPGVIFSDRVAALVERVRKEPGITVAKLIQVDVPVETAATPDLAAPPAPAPEVTAAATDEQMALMRDLRWLADEGYLIEYSDGVVFLGVQGEAASPKPAGPKPGAKAAAPDTGETPAEEPAAEVEGGVADDASVGDGVSGPSAVVEEQAQPEVEVEAPISVGDDVRSPSEKEEETSQTEATVEAEAENENAPEAEVAPEAKNEDAAPAAPAAE